MLIVGMLDSIHLARWLGQFRDEPIHFKLFPSSPSRKIHREISKFFETSQASESTFQIDPPGFLSAAALPLWLLDKMFRNRLRSIFLRRLASGFEPDFIHLIELQNAGYLGLAAFGKDRSRKSAIICTNYGSDIFWFQRFKSHRSRLMRLMVMCDLYSAECERDLVLAADLGFRGGYLPVIPNAGGFSEDSLEAPLPTDCQRDVIAVKGYHGWSGRGLNVVKALRNIEPKLVNLRVEIYSASLAVRVFVAFWRLSARVKVVAYPKHCLSHEQILSLFRRSKIYVGISRTDGISTSMLEAMACGAVPVQTSTSCCDEWFEGTGVAVSSWSSQEVETAILRALEMSQSESARITNNEIIKARASQAQVKKIAVRYYSRD
ncbi:glycosyltransferase [Aquiluna sp.]|nr:glycosyltransferase [Aquiluna sp.]